ncbi:MAG: TonB-dependent receptor [Rhizomicrobium sp.]
MRNRTRSRVLSGLFIGASSLAIVAGLATPSVAADATSGGIETITVTAQYTEQNIQATPLAISAVTGDDLERRGINDLSQLGTSIPGLSLTKAPAAFGNGVQTYIRGVGQYDTAFASEPGVGFYIDDIYYGTMSGSVFDLMDLNRIEVLKGPQGVLGGKNDIGGAIRMITQKPQDDNAGYLEVNYGSFNEINIKGAVDFTLIPDHLFARVSATSRQQNGYVTVIDYACAHPGTAGTLAPTTTRADCKAGTQGGTDVAGARFALRALFTPDIEDNFSVDVIRDNSESQPDVLYAADPGTAADPSGTTGDVFFNRGNGLVSVPRATFIGVNSDGAVQATTGIPTWNNANTPPFPPGPIAAYGIPWDQRFIPANPYTTTYGTYRSQAGLDYKEGAQMHAYSLTNVFDWQIIPQVHFKSITGYRYYDGAYSNDSDVSPMSFQLTTTYPTNREFQQEERFTGTLLDDHLEWTAGFFYYDRTNHAHGPVILDADYDEGSTFLVFEQNDLYTTVNRSAYVHAIYHIFDDLEVFGGARYTSEQKTYYFDHSGVVPGYPLGGFFRATIDPTLDCNLFAGHACDHTIHPALTPHTSRTNRPDWRAGIDYHVTDDIMTYFQFSTGYRTGGTNSRPFAPDQLDSYGPEQIKSYEIGAKTEWFDHRLRFNVAAYMSDYSDTITPLAQTDLSLGFPLPYVKYVNLGTSTNQGVELEATAAPIDNLVMDASFSYVDFSADPLPGAPAGWVNGCSAAAAASGICPMIAPGTVRVGTQSILVPKEQAHFDIQYTVDLGNGSGSLTPRLDYSWKSTVYQDANNNPFTAIPSIGTLDARLTWEPSAGGWQISASVYNLTDERYFLDMENFAIFGEGTVEAQPAPPREWMITLRKAF